MTSTQHLDWVADGGKIERGDTVDIKYHLDYTCVTGVPMRPLTSEKESLFSTAELSFASWAKPYMSKHAFNLTHTLEGRTFYLAKSESRIEWYLVFVPKVPDVLDFDQLNKVISKGMAKSPLKRDRAEKLADYLISLFLNSPDLAGSGVERSWSLKNKAGLGSQQNRVKLTARQWHTFQKELFGSWQREMVSDNLADTFWDDHTPCLHAYDYGQDVKLLTEDPEMDFEKHLARELGRLYNIDNAATFSCAVAANVTGEDNEEKAYAILGERQAIEAQYRHVIGGCSFYPLGLSPRAGNFQAQQAPSEIDNRLWKPHMQTCSNANSGKQVLFPGPFQGYSMIKQLIRHSPAVFLPRKRFWQAGLGLRRNLASDKALKVQNDILIRLQSGSDSDRAERPIAREVDQVAAAIATETFGYRFEQIINVRIDEIIPEKRSLDYIVQISVVPYVHWWHENLDVWRNWLIRFDPEVVHSTDMRVLRARLIWEWNRFFLGF